MPEPLAQDKATAIARGGGNIKAQLRRIIDRLWQRHWLAMQIFCGADGAPTRPAAEWLRRLARDNFVEGGGFDRDPHQNAFNEGRRALALEILGSLRIDADRLGALKKMEREVE